jgi:hypothetical protein
MRSRSLNHCRKTLTPTNFASSHARIVVAKTGTHFLQNTRAISLTRKRLRPGAAVAETSPR